MKEKSVTEQRYEAVLAVIAEGRTVSEVAREWGVYRQTSGGQSILLTSVLSA